MGNGNDKSNEVVIRQVDERNDNTDGQRGSNTSGSSTTTTTKRGTRGTDDRGSGRDRGTGAKAEQKEVVSGLPILKETDEEKKKREERNAKRRERYAKQKAEQGQTVKPKKVNTKKKKQEDVIDTNQLNIIIKTISTLIASRPNCSHWLLSDAEIESITTPLSKMMQESEIFNKIGEHSNSIALVTACVSIFVPRIIQTTMIVKENKKRVREVKQQGNQGKVISIDRPNDKQNRNADDGEVNGSNEHWTSTLIY